MKVLCTGATGFLGTHVVAALTKAKHDVISMGSRRGNPSTVLRCDLRSYSHFHTVLENLRPDAVIHLAAVVGGIGANVKSPADFWRDNLWMGINVLDLCKVFDIKRLVIAGTTCSYPEYAPIPFKEKDIWDGYPEPTNAPYGVAKRALIVGAQSFRKQYKLDARVLIPTNLYGIHDSLDLETNHVIPALIIKFLRAKKTRRKEVKLWGDGSPTRDFVFVEDVARAFVLAVESSLKWELLNIGTGREISIKDLAKIIAEKVGYKHKIVWDGKLGGQPRRVLDCTRTKQLLKWESSTTLEHGLDQTIDWIGAQLFNE